MNIRVWADPIPGEVYAIGGDPAEGLQHGDDSVYEVFHCGSGEQVCEVQGKIPPDDFADLGYELGTWYNHALIGIENNKDGGANRILAGLGYRNLYFDMADRGKPYLDPTQRLGINMNSRRRSELVTHSRAMLGDRSMILHSSKLIGQMEAFVLHGVKFQAITGAHDDLVMAMLIAGGMMMFQLSVSHRKASPLPSYVDGEAIGEEVETPPIVERVTKQWQTRQVPELAYSTGDLF